MHLWSIFQFAGLQIWRFSNKRTLLFMGRSVRDGPYGEYGRRLDWYSEHLRKEWKRHQFLWVLFLASTVATAAATASALWLQLHWVWLLAPAAFLVWSLRSMKLCAGRCSQLHAVVRFYESGMERLHSCWQGRGIFGEEYLPTEHLYASDIDLFGRGSLFEMLCTARTGIGRGTLADWLLHPAQPEVIRARQEAIKELRNNLGLQEEWAAAGRANPSRVVQSTLREWAQNKDIRFHPAIRVLAPILPTVLLVVLMFHGLGYMGANWGIAATVTAALEVAVAGACHKQVRSIINDVALPAYELGLLAPLLKRFQREQCCSPLLKMLQSKLSVDCLTSSREISWLRLWSRLLDLRQSEYFAAVAALLLWGTNVAILVECRRVRNRQRMPEWLEVVGQFEALLCLARYSFENPEHTFPLITDGGPAFFQADNLGHPLLAASKCVPCDVSLDARHSQLMILSGSNMSGKSTLLRSVGVNAVLAMAGAPVRASRLEMSALQIGCSVAVHDSLLNGKSRFAAEVERLKEILALARFKRSIVLLDELLGGTNSQDRLFGAQKVLDLLLRTGAVAIVTTHDLALTDLAGEFAGHATNAHFTEVYENGAMRFDYKLRDGVLPRTNGANVIAALGLLS